MVTVFDCMWDVSDILKNQNQTQNIWKYRAFFWLQLLVLGSSE